MSRYSKSSEGNLGVCGCYLVVFIFNLLVGGWSVNYLLEFFLGKTIPFIGATLIGMFAAEVSVPVAVVIAVLKFFGVL
jgi:hypothetical protein